MNEDEMKLNLLKLLFEIHISYNAEQRMQALRNKQVENLKAPAKLATKFFFVSF